MEEIKLHLCRKCGIKKPYSSFYKSSKNKSKLQYECKDCMRESKQLYRKTPKGRASERRQDKAYKSSEHGKNMRRLYTLNNREKTILKGALSSSKRKKLEFNLTIDDIKIPDFCPVLGIPITKNILRKQDGSPSIDRIDSNKGYIKGNICIISWRANCIKNMGNAEEHRKIAEYIERFIQP